jgi:hypothetical protein
VETGPSGDRKGVDVPAYAEIDAPTPSLTTKLALYEVQRENGAEPEEPLETQLEEKRAREGQDTAGVPVDVPAYAEIDAPTPSLTTKLALYEVQRENGAEPEEPLETELKEKVKHNAA